MIEYGIDNKSLSNNGLIDKNYCQSRIMCGSYGKTSHMADIGHFQK